MMSNVIKLRKPRTFTSAEAVIEEIRERIHMDGRTHRQLAVGTGVSAATIGNIAVGKTRWPRPTTLFPLMVVLGMKMTIS